MYGILSRADRTKRAGKKISGNVCRVHFTADPTFFREYARSSSNVAVSETAYFLNEATSAFEEADFDGNLQPDHVGFDLITLMLYESENAKVKSLAPKEKITPGVSSIPL